MGAKHFIDEEPEEFSGDAGLAEYHRRLRRLRHRGDRRAELSELCDPRTSGQTIINVQPPEEAA